MTYYNSFLRKGTWKENVLNPCIWHLTDQLTEYRTKVKNIFLRVPKALFHCLLPSRVDAKNSGNILDSSAL